jgi:hypothetical protein
MKFVLGNVKANHNHAEQIRGSRLFGYFRFWIFQVHKTELNLILSNNRNFVSILRFNVVKTLGVPRT